MYHSRLDSFKSLRIILQSDQNIFRIIRTISQEVSQNLKQISCTLFFFFFLLKLVALCYLVLFISLGKKCSKLTGIEMKKKKQIRYFDTVIQFWPSE